MTLEETPPQSAVKAQTEDLLESFQRSFDGGDYLRAREIAAELLELALDIPRPPG